jgi:hypothetical protein
MRKIDTRSVAESSNGTSTGTKYATYQMTVARRLRLHTGKQKSNGLFGLFEPGKVVASTTEKLVAYTAAKRRYAIKIRRELSFILSTNRVLLTEDRTWNA